MTELNENRRGGHIHPRPHERPSEESVKYTTNTGWKFLTFTVRTSPTKRVTNLQFINGQYLMTKPRLDESGETFTHCGAFTNSKDQPDATVIFRLPSHATIQPILSIRAFEFGSPYGLDLLIPNLRDVKQTMWVTSCFGKELFSRQMVWMELQKKTHTSMSRWVPRPPAHRVFVLTLQETPCQWKSNHEFGNWHVAVDTRARTSNCRKKDSQNPHAQKRLSRGRRCVFFWAKYKIIITTGMPDMKDVSPYNCFDNLTKSTDKGRNEICWKPHAAGERNCMQHSKNHFRKQHVDPLYIRAIQGHTGAKIKPNFLLQGNRSEKAMRHGSAISGLRRTRQPSNKEVGLIPGGCEGNKRRQAVY